MTTLVKCRKISETCCSSNKNSRLYFSGDLYVRVRVQAMQSADVRTVFSTPGIFYFVYQ